MLDLRSLLAVALGGGLGSVLRYVVGFAMTQRLGPGFPWGTLVVNLTGSLVIGIIAEFAQTRVFGVTPAVRLFLTVGVLGGYTTFSSFAYETLTLGRENGLLAFAYASGSVILGIAAALAGMGIARALAAVHA